MEQVIYVLTDAIAEAEAFIDYYEGKPEYNDQVTYERGRLRGLKAVMSALDGNLDPLNRLAYPSDFTHEQKDNEMSTDKVKFKVLYDRDLEEYRVVASINGVIDEKQSYYTDDKQDALNTLELMKQGNDPDSKDDNYPPK
ncbi:hypothetical protein LCGC14_2710060 [marine sediment metagenome]|uniref:Uncharacterized protein n=1 Tax=marine sediment metagenome TaxID=412755 RepID=A0A0F8ZD44_9ZZZZ